MVISFARAGGLDMPRQAQTEEAMSRRKNFSSTAR
jgi:hypothetical protein